MRNNTIFESNINTAIINISKHHWYIFEEVWKQFQGIQMSYSDAWTWHWGDKKQGWKYREVTIFSAYPGQAVKVAEKIYKEIEKRL